MACWAFNHRDSAKTCLHEETDLGLFMAEAVAPIQYDFLDAAFSELARDLRDAGADVGETLYVQSSSPAASVRLG